MQNKDNGTLTYNIYSEIDVYRVKFVSVCYISQNFII